ncbi:putative integral membrane protein [hydrocarbon metagenome]|uniref:Putative integral membrane protein n=1 Tax=hydrocarbon metagenome TaxID=938273 RepID=A0A0W8G7V1_9ZZZZ
MDLTWMEWTPITAYFFIFIGCTLAAMTVWQVLSPTVERKGFLPMATTRGDRLFIGLLGGCYILLAFIGLSEVSLWYALAVALAFLGGVMRFG